MRFCARCNFTFRRASASSGNALLGTGDLSHENETRERAARSTCFGSFSRAYRRTADDFGAESSRTLKALQVREKERERGDGEGKARGEVVRRVVPPPPRCQAEDPTSELSAHLYFRPFPSRGKLSLAPRARSLISLREQLITRISHSPGNPERHLFARLFRSLLHRANFAERAFPDF